MDKHTAFSIFLLVLVFSAGFSLSYAMRGSEWKCPACSFNPEDNVIPLVNDQFSEAVSQILDNAESEIDIAMYEMKYYGTNNSVMRLENILMRKAKEGVKVKVLMDQSEWQGKTTSLSKENWGTGDYLKAGGVDVKFDSKKTTTHDKLIIVDGRTVVVGSHNWGYSAFERNNEASVVINDAETAGYYRNYFDSLWANS